MRDLFQSYRNIIKGEANMKKLGPMKKNIVLNQRLLGEMDACKESRIWLKRVFPRGLVLNWDGMETLVIALMKRDIRECFNNFSDDIEDDTMLAIKFLVEKQLKMTIIERYKKGFPEWYEANSSEEFQRDLIKFMRRLFKV